MKTLVRAKRIFKHAVNLNLANLVINGRSSIDTSKLKIDLFKTARVISTDYHHLIYAASQSVSYDHVLEFGVWKGRSINTLAGFFGDKVVWGFDSFKGLPEEWIKNNGRVDFPKGSFGLLELPKVRKNVKLVEGYFNDTLPRWLDENHGFVRFLHIDCDLYSSAKTVLTLLNNRILKGTVIVFDELYRWKTSGMTLPLEQYENWQEHEWKALKEWMDEYRRKIKILCRNDLERAAVIVAN